MINSNKFPEDKKNLGLKGEEKAISILKDFGLKLSRPDYSGFFEIDKLFYNEEIKANEDIDFEIKTKSEPFEPPPFLGHGTDIYQIEKRIRRYKKYKIKQFFLVIQPDGKIYGQWLHKLESGKYFDTKFNKRIYPLESFFEIIDIFGK